MLRTLSFAHIHDGPIFVFGDSIRNLTTLILDGKAITDENLVAIGKHCTQLTTLSIFNTRFDVETPGYTDVGLHALMVGCPKLCHLVIRTKFHYVHAPTPFTPALVLQLWRKLRPRLIISESESSVKRFNVLDMPIDDNDMLLDGDFSDEDNEHDDEIDTGNIP